MNTYGQFLPVARRNIQACYPAFRAMARLKPPQNWSIEADVLLTDLHRTTSSFDIENFKSINATGAPQVSENSYDLVFLQSRLEELLGPLILRARPILKHEFGGPGSKYLDRIWMELEGEDGRNSGLRCIKCNTSPPAIYKNFKTERLRCGHCGAMNSSHLVKVGDGTSSGHTILRTGDLKREETMQHPRKPRTPCVYNLGVVNQGNTWTSAEVKTATWDLDTPSKRTNIDLPQGWNVVLDMSLKKEYRKNPKRFDIDGWKSGVHQTFHGAPNLCINPDSYDVVFLHHRLDKLIGPCICRLDDEDRQRLDLDDEPSFFHREWRPLEIDRLGHRLYCDRCKVSPPVICRNERSLDEYRCGACGNSNVSREPSDEPYYEHWNSVVDSLSCVLGKRKAAGLPEVPTEMVRTEVRKRMRRFQRDRTDKPKQNPGSSKQDEQEDEGGVKVESVESEDKENVRVKIEANDSEKRE